MVSAGVGGLLTGRGAHLLAIDDPVKDHAEAYSEVMRERAWDWWRSTAGSRLLDQLDVLSLVGVLGLLLLGGARSRMIELAGRVTGATERHEQSDQGDD